MEELDWLKKKAGELSDSAKKEFNELSDKAKAKYNEMTTKDPMFLGRAYESTQPKPLMASETFEEEQESFKKKQKTIN